MDLHEAMRTNRAIRRYRPEPVPDDVLLRCLEAATWAPSGSNRQAWRFCVLRSPEVRAVLGPAYRRGWEEMSQGYGVTQIDPADDSPRARMGRTLWHFVEHFEEVPAYVLFCVEDRGRPVALADGASIYPAVQNFMLAARAEGLGTVMTSWFQYCEAELREVVGVPDGWLLAGLLPVGWPVGRHGPVRRRPVTELAYADRWGEPLSR
jgi:nitroreductase